MTENARSNLAVLGAREIATEERAEWDYYSTDPNCVNDLLSKMPELYNPNLKVLEPCAGAGAIANRFEELTDNKVDKYDIMPHAAGIEQCNYMELDSKDKYDVIITNFPYKSSTKTNPIGFNELLLKALDDVKCGGYVISFQRLLQLESQKRWKEIYEKYRPSKVYVYVHRVKCFKDGDAEKYKTMNSTICYSWVVWEKEFDGSFAKKTELDWIV